MNYLEDIKIYEIVSKEILSDMTEFLEQHKEELYRVLEIKC